MTVGGTELRGIDVDMNAISDTVQTLAPWRLFAKGPTDIPRRGTFGIKRPTASRPGHRAAQVRRRGRRAGADGLRIDSASHSHAATIDTYDDHRMAMSMALVGLRVPGVVINDPGCTAKTYPDFFGDLERLA